MFYRFSPGYCPRDALAQLVLGTHRTRLALPPVRELSLADAICSVDGAPMFPITIPDTGAFAEFGLDAMRQNLSTRQGMNPK